MADKPILFSAPMIRALLDGRKTQTRRVIKQPDFAGYGAGPITAHVGKTQVSFKADLGNGTIVDHVPLGAAVGDRLWVRESARISAPYTDDCSITYCDGRWFEAGPCSGHIPDDALVSYFRWIDRAKKTKERSLAVPAIHLWRWASRLTLIVTDVRVQRLQEISEEDARAEGVYFVEPTEEDQEWYRGYCERHGGDPVADPMTGVWMAPGTRQGWGMTKAEREREQWGPTAQFAFRCVWEAINGHGAWEANPWVAAYTFTIHQANIDQLQLEAA